MKISLALFFTFILLTSTKTYEVEFRGVQKPLSIFVQRVSPAFAALEDTFESKSNPHQESLKNFQSQVTSIKSGEPILRVVKLEGFKINKSYKDATVVSLTKKAAKTAKDLLDKSFEFNPTSENVASEGIVLSTESKTESRNVAHNKQIDVDGVHFEIGSPTGIAEGIAQNNLPVDFLNTKIPGLENVKVGPISVSTKNQSQNLNTLSSGVSNVQISYRNLKGQIQLADGAVYPGERFEFYIQRIFDGVVHERGEINPWTGEFNISIKEPRGKVTVELRHDSGAIIAIGNLTLDKDLNLNETHDIKVIPAESVQHIGQVLSYESFEEHDVAINEPTDIYIDGDEYIEKTDGRGRIAKTTKLASGSQILVSASHKGYWNSLQIAEAGQPIRTVMHSDKHMKAFLNLIEPYLKKAQIHSVIWGRVTNQGQPISDVKVSLHGFEDIEPLYFSFRIPNPSLESTSADGFFAFINPPEGLHIVKSNQTHVPLESVIVRMDHTSIVSLEAAPKKNVNIYSYDAFSNEYTVPAKVSIPGTDSIWNVGHEAQTLVPFFDTATNMVMDIEPIDQAYIATRVFIGRRRSVVQVPHFRKEWVNSLLASQKINQMPRTTNLIGWVEQGTYKVDVFPKDDNTRIIYFNKEGHVVDNLVDGGGYLATNVPPGVVTSTLKNLKSNTILKRLSIAEPHRLSINYINDL